MQISLRLLLILAASIVFAGRTCAQTVYYSENFDAGFGGWTPNSTTGVNGTYPNAWFVSCEENGMAPGACGSGCIGAGNSSLHIASTQAQASANIFVGFLCPTGDCGAAYFAGDGTGDYATNVRAESPVIDLSEALCAPELKFNYIEGGEASSDNFTLDYFDGTSWVQLSDPAKTTTCANGQGQWTAYTFTLPTSAIGNPNVRIGFHWVNNDNGNGTDPSVAIDSVRIVGQPLPDASFTLTPLCGGDPMSLTLTNFDATVTYEGTFPATGLTFDPLNASAYSFLGPDTVEVCVIATDQSQCNVAQFCDTLIVDDCTVTGPAAFFSASETYICETDCIDFTDLSSGNIMQWSWSFPGASVTTSTSQNPTGICYAFPGTYDVSLSVTDSFGVVSDTTFLGYIQVTQCPGPSVDISYNVNTVCSGDTIFYQGVCPDCTQFDWSFPGGTPATSTLADQAVVYSAAGSYSVTLVGTDALGNTTTQSLAAGAITITDCSAGPVASFSASDSSICSGGCITFNNTSTAPPGSTFQWGLPGSNLPFPYVFDGFDPGQVCYASPAGGPFPVVLVVTDTAGVSDTSDVVFITVQDCPVPVALFSASATTLCEGEAVTFTDQSVNATQWEWTFANGTPASYSGQTPPDVTFATAGTHAVTLVVSDASGNDSTYTMNITVNVCGTQPVASFTPVDTTICSGSSVTFVNTSTASSSASYAWGFEGGTPLFALTQNPGAVTFATAGTYQIGLVVTDGGLADTLVQTITVEDCPVPVAMFSASTSVICKSDSITFTNQSQNATAWQWTFNGGTPATSTLETPPAVVFNSSGIQTITLVASDSLGNDSTYSLTVTVNPCGAPTAAFAASDSVICPGTCIQFFDLSDTAMGWAWTFPGGEPSFSTQKNPPYICYNTAGTYPVELAVYNTLGNDTLLMQSFITVLTPPVATINIDTVSILLGTSVDLVGGGGLSYHWYPALYLNFDTFQYVTAVPAAPVTYTLVVTSPNGCTASETAVIDIHPPDKVFVPNMFTPNGDKVNDLVGLYTTGDVERVHFEIYDRWGTQIFRTDDALQQWDGTFKGKLMNTGVYVYFYRVWFADGTTDNGKGDITLIR